MKMKIGKLVLALSLVLAITGNASALDLNSSYNLRYFPSDTLQFEVTTTGQVNAQGDLNMNSNEITNFFDQSKCGPEQAIKTVYANGSYECNNILQDQTVENLNETLLSGDIANQSIRMDGNDIEGPGSITNYYQSGVCPSGEVLDGINADGSYDCVSVDGETGVETLNQTLASGDIANQSIRMDGNDIEGPGSITNYFDNACGPGEVVDSVNADGSYSCVSVDGESSVEDLNSTLAAGNEANQSIDMMGNHIEAVGEITLGTNQGTYYVKPTELSSDASDLVIQGGDASGTTDNPGDLRLEPGMNTGGISGDVILGNGNSDSWTGIGTSSPDEFVDIEGGNLTVSGNSINDVDMLSGDSAAIDVKNGLDLNNNELQNFFDGACGSGQVIEQVNSDGSYSCIDPSEDVSTEGLNETLLAGDEANQSIDMMTNDITNIGDLTGTNIVNSAQINSGAVGTSELATDAVTNDSIDNTERVMLNGGTMTADLDLNSNNLDDVSNIYQDDSNTNFFDSDCASGELVKGISSDGTYNCAVVADEVGANSLNATLAAGDIANQSIRMDGNDITSIGNLKGSNIVNNNQIASGAVDSNELATDSVTNDSIDNSGTVMVNGLTTTGSLDMKSNSIKNFFSGACSSGQVVEQVNSDGSYSCVDPVEDIQDESLNETLLAGDIANQSIRMNGNDIQNPGQVDGVEIENPGNALEVSSNQYAVSTDSIGNSELANSESFTMNGATLNADLNMNNNAVNEIGSGATNITSTGAVDAGADINVNDNNVNDVNSIDGGGDAVDVDDNVDMNGNSLTTSSGEMCLGDQCS